MEIFQWLNYFIIVQQVDFCEIVQLVGYFSEVDAKCATGDYPPCGLSAGVRALPQWIQLGCGSSEYICAERGATFSADNRPDQLPDLSNHNSFFAETLRKNPGLWNEYKDKKTSLGVTFGHCIKTGVDNKGKFVMTNSLFEIVYFLKKDV